MPDQPKTPTKLRAVRIKVPEDYHDLLASQAEREGITLQGLLAPFLNALARKEIKQEFRQQAA